MHGQLTILGVVGIGSEVHHVEALRCLEERAQVFPARIPACVEQGKHTINVKAAFGFCEVFDYSSVISVVSGGWGGPHQIRETLPMAVFHVEWTIAKTETTTW